MKTNKIKVDLVKKLNKSQVDQLVDLHAQILRESFLNHFGRSFISRIYLNLVENQSNIVLLATSKSKIVGYLIASTKERSFVSDSISRSIVPLIYEILLALIKKPTLILSDFYYLFKQLFIESKHPELRFIAVINAYQGRGLGKKLIERLNKEYQKLGYKYYQVSTTKNNLSNNFYQKLGFKLYGERFMFGRVINYYLSPEIQK